MDEANIWTMNNVYVALKLDFLQLINLKIYSKFLTKRKFYSTLNTCVPFSTFKNILKPSYYLYGFYASLNLFCSICNNLNIPLLELQQNIASYKTQGGYNIIEAPILPIKITPIFDMILAHNIGDGTVIYTDKRQPYFGYRQFDLYFRLSYIKKLESVFGKIKFKEYYFLNSTRPYCPSVISSLFFNYYSLNYRNFLSKSARLPTKLLAKDKDHLLAVLIAFIIDEGNIDSTLISIKLRNHELIQDLYKLTSNLGYDSICTFKKTDGILYIKRKGMLSFFNDYLILLKKYPEVYLGKFHKKIENSFNIYTRRIYKTKGNRKIILNLIKMKDLTVNQIASEINMTRQGVRFHIHNLEKMGKIIKVGLIGERNIVYSYRRR